MKLNLVAAVTAVVASGGAFAGAPVDLGAVTIGVPTTFQGTVTPPGGFSDVFTFTLPANGGSGYSVSDFSLVIPSVGSFKTLFSSLALWSDGVDGLPLTTDDVPLYLKTSLGAGTLSFPYGATPAGGYYIVVAGTAVGSLGGLYTGAISANPVPVPEPETYALMLAGLGAIGFLARRRSAN